MEMANFYIISMLFITGAVFGSFYNVLIYRVPRKENFISSRSKCTACGEEIKAIDLIPIVSYVLLRGKCRYCGQKISIRYPLIEIMMGLCFVFSYLKYGFSWTTLEVIVLISICCVATFIDLDHRIIPNKLVIFALVTALIFRVLNYDASLMEIALGFLVGGGILLIIALLGPMGGGDIKFMAAMGLWLGATKVLLAITISFVFGALVGVLLIALKIKSRKDYIPFGPFLSLGSIIAFVYFNEIITMYLNYFVRG